MAVNLTSGAIAKILTRKFTSKDPGPVLQVKSFSSSRTVSIDNKQWYEVVLSDGSFSHPGFVADDKLQKGSIFRLTKNLQWVSISFKKPDNGEIVNLYAIGVCDYNLLCSKCDIIGNPKPYAHNETPLVTPTIPDEDHANSPHVEEPPTSIQNPSTSTQKCSSHSPTQNKKRKLQSSDDDISVFGKYISDVMIMMVEITKDVRVVYKKLETLEEDVSMMKNMMIEKTKEDDVGACYKKLEILEQDVSVVKNMMIEKTKEDDVGACYKKLETLEQDVSVVKNMMIEKTKEDDVGACYKKLETLEQDVSVVKNMMIEKTKEDDVGACYKKLETLEEDVSVVKNMMIEKTKEDDVGACYKKLETLEEDVSMVKNMMIEKTKENDVDACYKKLETLEQDVSRMAKMMMDKNKEDDMGACFEKLDKLGWVAQDPMYDTAILLFGQSADYRKLWLHLKPESCGNWVKNAGNMFGLLD